MTATELIADALAVEWSTRDLDHGTRMEIAGFLLGRLLNNGYQVLPPE